MTDQRERREGSGQKWQKWFKDDVSMQKKVLSDRPGLVHFAIGLVILVLNFPNGQVLYFAEIQITEGL